MRDAKVFSFTRAMPRMSWSKHNLYNLWRRSLGELRKETDFTRTQATLFQQRWAAKALVRAYHGDFINEKIFKRWYLPSTLPDVRPRRVQASADAEVSKWARPRASDREARRQEEDSKELAPVGSLMFAEIERRIDVIIFRSCLASSVYEARRLVVHGDVLLNGKKHQNANTRLAPGDMVSVNPEAIRFLKEKPEPEVEEDADAAEEDKVEAKSEAESEPSSAEAEVKEGEDSAKSESEPAEAEASSAEETAPKKKSPKPKKRSDLTPFNLPPYASPFIFVPAYLEVSFATCSAIYVRHPTARPGYSEIPTPYEADGEIVRLAWEWYSKVRPRMRSKRQLARMPENRQ